MLVSTQTETKKVLRLSIDETNRKVMVTLWSTPILSWVSSTCMGAFYNILSDLSAFFRCAMSTRSCQYWTIPMPVIKRDDLKRWGSLAWHLQDKLRCEYKGLTRPVSCIPPWRETNCEMSTLQLGLTNRPTKMRFFGVKIEYEDSNDCHFGLTLCNNIFVPSL